jgi:hypothetical protein
MKNPYRQIRWVADWMDDRKAEQGDRKLRQFYAAKVAEAEKTKDWKKRDEILSEWQFESQLVLDPVYGRKAERLTAKARRYGITVPSKPASYDGQDDDWYPSNVTGEWLLTKTTEERLRREVKAERRASYEEFRKWATLVFAIAGFTLAFYSIRTKNKQPDPCPRNYYRSDLGQCVFALEKTAPPPQFSLTTVQPSVTTPPRATKKSKQRLDHP